MLDTVIDMETIAYQKGIENERFKAELLSRIDALLSLSSSTRLTDEKLNDDTTAKRLLEEMSKIITDRLGIPIKVISDKGFYSAHKTAHVNDLSTLNIDRLQRLLTAINEAKDDGTLDTEGYEDIKELTAASDLYFEMLNKGKVKVDFKNAKIIGLRKDIEALGIKNTIGMSFSRANRMKFTSEEVLSIFMHEAGHIFNNYAFACRYANDMYSLYQSLTDNKLADKDKITIALRKIGEGADSPKEDLLSFVNYIVTIGRQYQTFQAAYFNSEMGANSFASRFGLTSASASSLIKLHKHYDEYPIPRYQPPLSIIGVIAFRIMMLVVKVVATAWVIAGLVSLTALTVIFYPLGYAILLMIGMEFVYNVSKARLRPEKGNPDVVIADEHDSLSERLERLKRDAIRVMRTDKDANVKPLLNAINLIEENTKDLEPTVWKLLDKNLGYKTFRVKDVFNKIEALIENDLHILKAKLNTI